MFFVDKPYVSDFFKKTVKDNNIPIVATDSATQPSLYPGTTMLSERDAIEIMGKQENAPSYIRHQKIQLAGSQTISPLVIFPRKLTCSRIN